MEDLKLYRLNPIWDPASVPPPLLRRHNTQAGTWGRLQVLRGRLKFYELDEIDEVLDEVILTPASEPWTIYPQMWHRIELLDDDTQFQLGFYCTPADYFQKKYQMSKTHSAIVAAAERLKPGAALDLGCGNGRNAVYLAQRGFDVLAVDYNPQAVAQLGQIAVNEGLERLQTTVYDINQAALAGDFDFIFSTVTFMFLEPERVPAIIADMQAHTRAGGHNLIVSAMDTAAHPCHMPFTFTFKEGELKRYYAGWELLEYNEDIGSMHATDRNGNPIQLQFATLLARKP